MRTLTAIFSLILVVSLIGCNSERPPGPVRSEREAISIAKRYAGEMAFEDTRVVARQSERTWMVRGEKESDPGHPVVVTIDGASGQVTDLKGVEYRVSIRGSKP